MDKKINKTNWVERKVVDKNDHGTMFDVSELGARRDEYDYVAREMAKIGGKVVPREQWGWFWYLTFYPEGMKDLDPKYEQKIKNPPETIAWQEKATKILLKAFARTDAARGNKRSMEWVGDELVPRKY